MASYKDLLKTEDANLYMGGYKETDHKAPNMFKLWNFNMGVAPKKGVNLKHWWCTEQTGNVRSSSTVTVSHEQHKFDLLAKNDLYQVTYFTPSMEQADWKANASVMWSDKFNKEQIFESKLNLSSPDMSGVRANFAFDFHNKAFPDVAGKLPKDAKPDAKPAMETVIPDTRVKVDAGFQYEKDLVFAFKIDHGLNNHFGLSQSAADAKLKKDADDQAAAKAKAEKDGKTYTAPEPKPQTDVECAVAYRMDKNRVWAGYDFTGKFVKAGGLYKHDDQLTLMKEVRYTIGGTN